MITIYTNGSAESGYKNGGSAAVLTSGTATGPVKITFITRKGRRLTSSYETEVTAMLLAVGWIKNRENQGPFIICTDSQSTLIALQSPGLSDGSDLAETRRILNSLNTRVSIQWVPGHIGLIGNEWTDGEAGAMAASDEEPAATDVGLTFQIAKAFTKTETMDPAITTKEPKQSLTACEPQSPSLERIRSYLPSSAVATVTSLQHTEKLSIPTPLRPVHIGKEPQRRSSTGSKSARPQFEDESVSLGERRPHCQP